MYLTTEAEHGARKESLVSMFENASDAVEAESAYNSLERLEASFRGVYRGLKRQLHEITVRLRKLYPCLLTGAVIPI